MSNPEYKSRTDPEIAKRLSGKPLGRNMMHRRPRSSLQTVAAGLFIASTVGAALFPSETRQVLGKLGMINNENNSAMHIPNPHENNQTIVDDRK